MSDPIETSRRLVAVFAADVEGYSRLMGADEVGTLKGLTERRAILDKAIADHRGRIANTAGDSVLAEFGSAVDAVQCAVEAQAALAEANSSLPTDKRINFRIGIHVGDVMVRAGDLFGDGVNIAARLQTLAQPGGVCVSGATYEQVTKVLPVAFTDLGAQQVKNIEEPVRAYAVGTADAAAAFAACGDEAAPASRQAIDRGAPVPEHVRRPRAGVLRGRDGRGHHHRALAVQIPVCHRAQFELHLQGQSASTLSRSDANWACATCSKAASARRAGACGLRDSLLMQRWCSSVGRPFRRRARQTFLTFRTASLTQVVGVAGQEVTEAEIERTKQKPTRQSGWLTITLARRFSSGRVWTNADNLEAALVISGRH